MRAHRLPTAAVVVTIAIIAIVTPAARIDATTTACTRTSGVTVIVDFAAFHHGIARGCASGRPASALAAMQSAGFETAGTTQYGDAFLCRIDNLPAPKNEACAVTPSARSSWSFYWGRPTDATWTYSRVGVLSFRPLAGTIIAFAFGNLAKPGLLPSAAMRSEPTPTTTTTAPAPTGTRTRTSTNPPVVAAAVTTTTVPPAPTTTTTTTTTATHVMPARTTTSASPSTSTTAAGHVVDRAPITHETVSGNSGSPTGVALAVVLVIGIGVAAGFTIRARRRRAT